MSQNNRTFTYRPSGSVDLEVNEVSSDGKITRKLDNLASEEPMELRIVTESKADTHQKVGQYSIAVTMRTPGNDFELAAGFLLSEGVVKTPEDIVRISYSNDMKQSTYYNIVDVYFRDGVDFDPEKLSRHVFTSSSCGICGKGSLEQVRVSCNRLPVGDFQVSRNIVSSLPESLRSSQILFSQTGGLHASALFDEKGSLLLVREDVGRHNALDKLVGAKLLEGKTPLSNTILLVSGRASFELVQKAVMAGIPFLAAVGAPSNLAVNLANEFGMTLVGFLRKDRFNVYTGVKRIC